jgi:hypothetical protein
MFRCQHTYSFRQYPVSGVKRVYKDHVDHSHADDIDVTVKGGNAHLMALLDRVSGEFMVLGFLAFCVWSCNQNKGFDKIADVTGGPDGYTLLHLFEAVHMYLFVGMVLNFVTAAILVLKIVKWQVLMAKYENPDVVNGAQEPEATTFHSQPPLVFRDGGVDHTSAQKFKALKAYFMEITGKDDTGKQILDNFNFARYLAVCCDQILTDTINFSEYTWVMVLAMEAISAITSSLFSYGVTNGVSGGEIQQAVLAGLSLLVLIIVRSILVDKSKLDKMIEISRQPDFSYESVVETGVGQSLSIETGVARVLQALMFFVCYTLASFVANKYFWDKYVKHGSGQVILLVYYTTLYIVNAALIMPEAIFTATITLALPPYVDDFNFRTAQGCAKKGDSDADVGLVDVNVASADTPGDGVPTMASMDVEAAAPDPSAVVGHT